MGNGSIKGLHTCEEILFDLFLNLLTDVNKTKAWLHYISSQLPIDNNLSLKKDYRGLNQPRNSLNFAMLGNYTKVDHNVTIEVFWINEIYKENGNL